MDSRAGEVYAEANPTSMDPKETDKAAMTCNKQFHCSHSQNSVGYK
jgi:hypothetical protein